MKPAAVLLLLLAGATARADDPTGSEVLAAAFRASRWGCPDGAEFLTKSQNGGPLRNTLYDLHTHDITWRNAAEESRKDETKTVEDLKKDQEQLAREKRSLEQEIARQESFSRPPESTPSSPTKPGTSPPADTADGRAPASSAGGSRTPSLSEAASQSFPDPGSPSPGLTRTGVSRPFVARGAPDSAVPPSRAAGQGTPRETYPLNPARAGGSLNPVPAGGGERDSDITTGKTPRLTDVAIDRAFMPAGPGGNDHGTLRAASARAAEAVASDTGSFNPPKPASAKSAGNAESGHLVPPAPSSATKEGGAVVPGGTTSSLASLLRDRLRASLAGTNSEEEKGRPSETGAEETVRESLNQVESLAKAQRRLPPFSMNGADSEQSLREQEGYGDDASILGRESESLFVRVRSAHRSCLKHHCVN